MKEEFKHTLSHFKNFQLLQEEIEWIDPSKLFLAAQNASLFYKPASDFQRYSYLSFDIEGFAGFYSHSVQVMGEVVSQNPFEWMKENVPLSLSGQSSPNCFQSGYFFYWNYELAYLSPFMGGKLERFSLDHQLLGEMFLLDPLLIFDHQEKKCLLSSYGLNFQNEEASKLALKRIETLKTQILKWINQPSLEPPSVKLEDLVELATEVDSEDLNSYQQKVDHIRERLSLGEAYLVNFSRQYRWKIKEASLFKAYFQQQFQKTKAPYSCYFQNSEKQILSFSPELLLKVSGSNMMTRPIKGTRIKTGDNIKDDQALLELKNSQKEKAELLMVVDLMRNDFSLVALLGSIQVNSLFDISEYSYVFHQEAVVSATLKSDYNMLEALISVFPGASVTGAPKIKAMEIIQMMEEKPRGLFTGTLGLMDPRGFLEASMAIRTLETKGEEMLFGVGGGVVVDSDPVFEEEETQVKMRVLL